MKKVLQALASILLIGAISLVFVSPSPCANPKAITIKSAAFLPVNHIICSFIPVLIDRINNASKGEIDWKLIGGPEVVAGLDQFEAIKRGTLDAGFLVAADYAGSMPEAYAAALSRLEPWEERKSGFYDLFNKIHQGQNTYYLGRWHKLGFYIWTNKPAEKLADLKGRKIRGGGTLYDPWFEKLGIAGVQIPYGDVYTALQRGVVDGFAWPMYGVSDSGWLEVTKNCIDHEVFSSSDAVVIVNLSTWNKIPKGLRDTIAKVCADAEHDMVSHYAKLLEQERQKALKAGVKLVKLPQDEAKRYVDMAYEGGWSFVEKKVKADRLKEMKKDLSK